MSAKRDPVARRLALGALAVSLVALVLAGYGVHLGLRYLEDVQTLGEAIGERAREIPAAERVLDGPPPALDVD
ncbi:MAG: hypothetical protein JJ863_19740 [Deltaproteobacteria bacterium]|nr:hypothetical protein [Deltaproteobacteria bacterium]